MIRALWIALTVASLIIFCSAASAQRVPLALDQTITLPTTSGVWDVMPHPDGYYVWVQAIGLPNEQARVFSGRTGDTNTVSFDLALGEPASVTCFWKGAHEACMILSSIRGGDTSLVRIYRIEDGLADSAFWIWSDDLSGFGYTRLYRIIAAGLNPPPPAITEKISVLVTSSHFSTINFENLHGWISYHPCLMISGLLSGGDSRTIELNPYARNACTLVRRDSTLFVCSGDLNAWSYFVGDEDTSITSYSTISTVQPVGNTYQSDSLAMCDDRVHLWTCPAEMVAATCNSTDGSIYAFTEWGSAFSVLTEGGVAWTTSTPYDFWLSAECVPGNATEEFLSYRASRRVFDVLDATDGHSYGVTDTLSIPADGAMRITGRYDSTSRRLTFRDGNQLKLYRFGEYLGTEVGQRPTEVEQYALSAYPNPFNPTTTISFTLPQAGDVEINVFDITGRLVREVMKERMSAGEHRILFEASNLPSGIYLARMESFSMRKTAKLVVLK